MKNVIRLWLPVSPIYPGWVNTSEGKRVGQIWMLRISKGSPSKARDVPKYFVPELLLTDLTYTKPLRPRQAKGLPVITIMLL